jgi:hypothetical protein
MEAKRLLGPVLAVVLLATIGGGVWFSNRKLTHEAGVAAAQAQEFTARGLIGSEKEAFFSDPRVIAALARHNIHTQIQKAGSRAIAHGYDANQFDFGFPSGAPAAAELKSAAKASETFVPFYTPIVIASWLPIAKILVANGLVEQRDGIYFVTDLPRLLELIDSHQRWKDLKGSSAFATNKAVLINSTDVRTSNSAAMYLALASYVLNGQSVVQSQAEVEQVLPKAADLFLRQGFQETSSAGPFEDYLALGMGKTPLLVAYESQFVTFMLEHPDRARDGMVLLYPVPTVYSKHVLVPYNEKGAQLGKALVEDPELQSLAHEFGFRTGGDVHGPELWAQRGVKVPAQLTDVVDPPSHEWLESMIVGIEQRFKQ